MRSALARESQGHFGTAKIGCMARAVGSKGRGSASVAAGDALSSGSWGRLVARGGLLVSPVHSDDAISLSVCINVHQAGLTGSSIDVSGVAAFGLLRFCMRSPSTEP